MQTSVSTRFNVDTISRLDEMARHLGHSRSALIKDAVDHYLEYLTWYAKEMQKGEEDITEGRYLSHEELKNKFKSFGV